MDTYGKTWQNIENNWKHAKQKLRNMETTLNKSKSKTQIENTWEKHMEKH